MSAGTTLPRTIAAIATLTIGLVSAMPRTSDAADAPAEAVAAAASEPAVERPGEQGPSETEKAREKFEALRERRLASLAESAAFDSAAQQAIGSDRRALADQALELRLDGASLLLDMARLIDDVEAHEQDASPQRRALLEMLPPLDRSIREDYAAQTTALERLKRERLELSDDAALDRNEWAIVRQRDLVMRILTFAIDVVELEEAMQLATEQTRARIERQVQDQARLAASHLAAAARRLKDLTSGMASIPDGEQRARIEDEAKARLQGAASHLGKTIDLMERLDLDTTVYRQILISSTGEVTVEAIDTRVAGELISRWAKGIRESITANGPNILFQTLLFVLILSIFWGLSRFVRNVVARAVEAPNLRFSQLLKRMVVSLSTGAVLLLGLLIGFSQLGIEVGPMLAGLGIAGFVLGFALQDTLGNFASGVMILIYRPFDVGDMIDCAGGVFGKVSHMSLVSTTILTIDNKTLIVPNSKIWGDVITNVTAQSIRRVDLEFGIGYGDDIPKTEAVLTAIVEAHPKVLEQPEPVVKVHALGDSSVNFIVRPWVASQDYWDVYWDITREVKLGFDREGISIPFPQRDVHLYREDPGPADPAE